MKRDIFLRIHDAVVAHDSDFVRKRNVVGKLGLSSLQKVTTAFRMLVYGVAADYTYEYVQIGETTTIDSLRHFIKTVVEVFGEEYLRSPNCDDLTKLLVVGEERGFQGMFGSIDCMHWTWKNCPTTWHGMYSGHIGEPTIILEVVASYDLWIWNAFFGLSRSLNDINVLERSFVFSDLAEGRAPCISYVVNGRTYNMGYYLADGIYPSCATLVKAIPTPLGNKHKHFAKQQEGARKDMECAFRVLQQRFAIVRGPARFWDMNTLKNIMTTCIIMHNIIVEDEHDERQYGQSQVCFGKEYDQFDEVSDISSSLERTPTLMEFIENHRRIKDKEIHTQLQEDLIEQLWKTHGK